jgi:hypothetical protein
MLINNMKGFDIREVLMGQRITQGGRLCATHYALVMRESLHMLRANSYWALGTQQPSYSLFASCDECDRKISHKIGSFP